MIYHIPVMLGEILESIPSQVSIVLDGTLGHGGHTRAMLQKFPQIKKLYAIDLDPNIFPITKEKLSDLSEKIEFINGSYTQIFEILGGQKVDFILLDLGVNMEHFKDASRGFSINQDSKLDMRFDNQNGQSAYDILHDYSTEQLSKMFTEYAEFTSKKADEIAQKIVGIRKNKKIETTFQLKLLLNQLGLGQKASTVIFQAIRIETNKEMDNLKLFLDQIPDILFIGGRCGIITFHSVEDRIVKNKFREFSQMTSFKLLYKKALQPSYMEVKNNRASRSAKYRVIQRIF